MFLSTAEIILILVYFFDTIVIETLPVLWVRKKSIVFSQVFYYMEDLWINILNRMDQKLIVFCQCIV